MINSSCNMGRNIYIYMSCAIHHVLGPAPDKYLICYYLVSFFVEFSPVFSLNFKFSIVDQLSTNVAPKRTM